MLCLFVLNRQTSSTLLLYYKHLSEICMFELVYNTGTISLEVFIYCKMIILWFKYGTYNFFFFYLIKSSCSCIGYSLLLVESWTGLITSHISLSRLSSKHLKITLNVITLLFYFLPKNRKDFQSFILLLKILITLTQKLSILRVIILLSKVEKTSYLLLYYLKY